MIEERECPTCYQEVEVQDNGAGLHYSDHLDLDGEQCPGSNEMVQEDG